MEFSENQIVKNLEDLYYIDKRNNKKFYSLKEICEEFNIYSFRKAYSALLKAKEKLESITYTVKSLSTCKINEKGVIEDVYLSPVGLMFTMAQLSQESEHANTKKVCYEIAKVIKSNQISFYPEKRVLLRREYTEVTKELRSKVKSVTMNNFSTSLKSYLHKLYTKILFNYYFINDLDVLAINKTGNPNGKYLDYISCKELYDLIEVQKQVLDALNENPSINFIKLAGHLANDKRREYLIRFVGVTPLKTKPHNSTPFQMLKQFNAILKDYRLDDKTLVDEKNKFEK